MRSTFFAVRDEPGNAWFPNYKILAKHWSTGTTAIKHKYAQVVTLSKGMVRILTNCAKKDGI